MTLAESRTYSISDAAAETGLTTSTLRYYEDAGLMRDEVDRASSNHRRYTPEMIGWVTFITKLRSTGMPIRDIRRYAELVRQGESSNAARLALLVAHRERVLAQLAEVQHSLTAIDHKIATYERLCS